MKSKERPKERRKPVLLVQHAPHEHPAAIRRALESQGIQTQWIHAYLGDPYPKVSSISGLISLGGPMGANDEAEHPWIKAECQLLRESVESELPVVGICLGAQMMAKALGGHVEKNQTAEIGWFPIRLNDDGQRDPILSVAGDNPTVYHWHGDTFHLPSGHRDAVLLAHSQACPRQAFRVGERAYGFQFHPEADHQLVHEWLEIEGVENDIRAAQEVHGEKFVQFSELQRKHALNNEIASLKLTASVGSLFRRHTRIAVANFRDQIDELLATRAGVTVEFEGSDRKPKRLVGQIVTELSLPTGSYVIFREENKLLWPICVEDILKIAKITALTRKPNRRSKI